MGELSIEVDRSSPVPLYFQAARQIEQAIERGELRPGTRLDNEIQLAGRFGLSRPTMRRAIQELVGKGLLVRKRGVGTQVVQAQVKRPLELTSLYDDLRRGGQEPATRVLVNEEIAADEELAGRLGVAAGAAVVRLERLRLAGGEPLAILRNWLPAQVARPTAAELEAVGLYALLRRGGVNIQIASQRIGARAATAGEARLLDTKRAAAVLTMERTAFDDSGRAVELGCHVYRSDTYSFEITLVHHA